MEENRCFLRNLRWEVTEQQLRVFFSGWPITRVQIVRKQYYGSRSLISAFITLDSRDSVDRMVEMMNGRSYAALTPTFVQAERAVPRMKDLQAMYVPPGAEPKMRPRPKVQAEPLLHPAMEEFKEEKTELAEEAKAEEHADAQAEAEPSPTEVYPSSSERSEHRQRSRSSRRSRRSSRRSRRKSRRRSSSSSSGQDSPTSPADV